MAILKTQALYNFFSGFELPAYEENTVPTGANEPYSGSCAAHIAFIYVSLTLYGWPSHAIRLAT